MRDRALGNSILAILFGIGAIGAAARVWQLFSAKGFDVQTAIWLLALLGLVSLTWRSIQAARTAQRHHEPPR
jgi:hypothetical protein